MSLAASQRAYTDAELQELGSLLTTVAERARGGGRGRRRRPRRRDLGYLIGAVARGAPAHAGRSRPSSTGGSSAAAVDARRRRPLPCRTRSTRARPTGRRRRMRLRLFHAADGARIAYREAGTGPPLVLLHSARAHATASSSRSSST